MFAFGRICLGIAVVTNFEFAENAGHGGDDCQRRTALFAAETTARSA